MIFFCYQISVFVFGLLYLKSFNRIQKMKTLRIPIQSPRIFKPIENTQNELYEEPLDQKWSLIKRNTKLRETSIDFLVKACAKHNFKKDTLFLAIKLLDTLIKQNFQPFTDDHQLTTASLVILATKYNEVYPVTIDQINLVTEKYYPRQSILKIQGLILECLNFEMPEVTVFSELYNELKPLFGKKPSSDCNKENEGERKNLPPKPYEKDSKQDEQILCSKALKAIREPETLKYGEEFLFQGLLSYLRNEKYRGSSVNIVKTNYIKTLVKRAVEPEKQNQENQNRKPSIPKYLSPRETKLNPENKMQRKQKIFVF